MLQAVLSFSRKNMILYCIIGLILFISFFTYFRNYYSPDNLFWDENYHITSAQKYLNGVFFMSDHPPLGKMFIALGEYIFHPNSRLNTNYFVTTDYIKEVPAGYSFVGVRFFPTLFAAASAILFFFILFKISKRLLLSFLFTSIYLFENSYIVHSRGAMLESAHLFFIYVFILYFLALYDRISGAHKLGIGHYLIFGSLFGLLMSVKLNGFMCVVFFLMIALYEAISADTRGKKINLKKSVVSIIKRGIFFGLASLFVFGAVYYLHFAIAKKPVEGRYYEAQEQYKRIIDSGKTASPAQFPYQFSQNISYIFHYEKGVPKYDYCKEGENGSLPITWPFGAKGINYRWASNDGKAQYLYLQGNPVNWLLGLVGLFLSINIYTSVFVLKMKIKNRRLFTLMVTFLMFYLAYMASMLTLERVMYLYHYFIPLSVSFFIFFLVLLYLYDEQMKRRDMTIYGVSLGIIFAVILGYLFFSPLTYYLPLSKAEFELRNWFSFWGLVSVL